MTRAQFNVFSGYVAMAWNALMGLVFIPAYLHYLGIEAYGLIGVFTSLQVWFAVLDFGMMPTINREMARFEGGAHSAESIRTLFNTLEILFVCIGAGLGIGIVAAATSISVGWLKVEHLPVSTVADALKVMGATVAVRWVAGLYRNALMGLQRQSWLNLLTVIFATARGLGAVALLAFVAPSIELFFWYQALLVLIETLVLAVQIRTLLPRCASAVRFRWASLIQVWKFAAMMSGITILATLLTQIDKLLLSKLVTLSEFGAYSLAYSVCANLLNLVYPIDSAAYPCFSQLVAAANSAELVRVYRNFSQTLALIVVPAAIVLSLFSEYILMLWTRNPATVATIAPLVTMVAVGTMLNALMHIPYALQIASGWPQFTFAVNSIAVVFLVPTIYLAVQHIGVLAGPLGWGVLNLGYVVIAIGFMHRRLLPLEKWPWYRYAVLWPIAAALGAAWFVRLLAPDPQLAAPMKTFSAVGLALILASVATAAVTPVGRQTLHALPRLTSEAFMRLRRRLLAR